MRSGTLHTIKVSPFFYFRYSCDPGDCHYPSSLLFNLSAFLLSLCCARFPLCPYLGYNYTNYWLWLKRKGSSYYIFIFLFSTGDGGHWLRRFLISGLNNTPPSHASSSYWTDKINIVMHVFKSSSILLEPNSIFLCHQAGVLWIDSLYQILRFIPSPNSMN